MQKPEHDAWCQLNHPSPACPACAWEGAVEATLDDVSHTLRTEWYQGPVVVNQLVEGVRERVK